MSCRSRHHCGLVWWFWCLVIALVGYEADQHAILVGSIIAGVVTIYLVVVALMMRAGKFK